MRILICPDSFKGTLSAAAAAEVIEAAWHRARPKDETVLLPLADGGEGTLDAILRSTGGTYREEQVMGPLGDHVRASWGTSNGAAIIEMAAASGLLLVSPAQRNPLLTTTFGTGQLIRAALDAGFRDLLIGIGGSATNDAGLGMAQALGYRLIREDGSTISEPASGKHLAEVSRIDSSQAHPCLRTARIRVACDVTNPLCGSEGAAYVYAPQKGADAAQVEMLDQGLRHVSEIIKRYLGVDVAQVPGAGAAGGLGAGLIAFCGAHLVSGIDTILDVAGFDEKLRGCGLVITGEGKVDRQTLRGKAISGVLRRARAPAVPVLVVAGRADVRELPGAIAVIAASDHAPSPAECLRDAAHYLALAVEHHARSLQ